VLAVADVGLHDMRKTLQHLILLVLCALGSSCANRQRSTQSDQETGVYEVVLSQCFSRPWWRARRHYVVIEERSVNLEVHFRDANGVLATPTPENLSIELHGRFPGIGSDTVTNYIHNSTEPMRHLKPGSQLGVPYTLATKDEIDSIMKSPKGVSEFPHRYRGFAGLLTLSRVGFNREGTEALVYIECVVGGLDGSGDYYLLRQDKHRWVIVSSSLVWIS